MTQLITPSCSSQRRFMSWRRRKTYLNVVLNHQARGKCYTFSRAVSLRPSAPEVAMILKANGSFQCYPLQAAVHRGKYVWLALSSFACKRTFQTFFPLLNWNANHKQRGSVSKGTRKEVGMCHKHLPQDRLTLQAKSGSGITEHGQWTAHRLHPLHDESWRILKSWF